MKLRWIWLRSMAVAVVATVGSAVLLSGCLLEPEEEDEDSASITISAIGTIQAGQNKTIEGTVEGSPELTITYEILDSAGTVVGGNKVIYEVEDMTGETKVDLATDANLTIKTQSDACNGSYSLKINATAGSATTTKEADFTIAGGKDCGKSTTPVTTGSSVTLGAQGAASGSYLDVDAWKAYNSSGVSGNESDIDVLLGYAGDVLRLYSPAKAKNDGFIPGWTSPPSTPRIASVSSDFSGITSKEEIEALFPAGGGSEKVAISANDVVVVKSGAGAYVLIKVESVSGSGKSAEISVIGKY